MIRSYPSLLWFGLILGLHQSITFVPDDSHTPQSESAIRTTQQEVLFYISEYWKEILIGLIVIFVLFCILWAIRAWSLAGLTHAIHTFELHTEKKNILSCHAATWRFIGKIMLLQFLFALSLAILSIVLILPIFIFAGLGAKGTAITLGIFATALFIPIAAILFISFRLGIIYVVTSKLKTFSALDAGYKLFTKNILPHVFFIFFLVLFEIILIGILSFFPVITVLNTLSFVFIPEMTLWNFSLYTVAVILILTMFFTFKNTAWTLFFIKIAKRPKKNTVIQEKVSDVSPLEKKEVEPVRNME